MGNLDPELDVAVAAMVGEGARFVVVGGFAVTANRLVRATEHVDFLVPDDDENDRRILAALRKLGGVRHRDDASLDEDLLIGKTHLRTKTTAGIIDIIRGGLPPLDYETVEGQARDADYGGAKFKVAGVASIVGFKRLADRPRDRNDLEGLAEVHGELPIDEIPGVDS